MKSSSYSAAGGGAYFFFLSSFFYSFLGYSFLGASVAFAGPFPAATGAGPEPPINLDPSAISWWIGFPFTDSRSLLISSSSALIWASARTFLTSAAAKL